MTLDFETFRELITYCVSAGLLFGAAPVLVTVFLGVAMRVFEDIFSA